MTEMPVWICPECGSRVLNKKKVCWGSPGRPHPPVPTEIVLFRAVRRVEGAERLEHEGPR